MTTIAPNDRARWTRRPAHRVWLAHEADRLFDFFQRHARDPRGGFRDLDDAGAPLFPAGQAKPIHIAARAVHCFSLAALRGRPGAADVVDHGLEFLWRRHRDADMGGYVWSVDDDGPRDDGKLGYGHAFVLLAASSARWIGHPLADEMLADVATILDERFWEEEHGAIREGFTRDWREIEPGYRGQNANMHLCEAMMAAFEATGESLWLERAGRIADLIVRRASAATGWRTPEHFHSDWTIDKSYRCSDEQFRPSGVTPGHWFEWARLVLQLHHLGAGRFGWAPAAARGLFAQGMALGWDARHGGLFYTLDWNDRPDKRMKLWWPLCEAIGAAHVLAQTNCDDGVYEAAYRRLWTFAERVFIDPAQGGWFEERSEDLRRVRELFPGKVDIYHAVQACLIPLYADAGGLAAAIAKENAG